MCLPYMHVHRVGVLNVASHWQLPQVRAALRWIACTVAVGRKMETKQPFEFSTSMRLHLSRFGPQVAPAHTGFDSSTLIATDIMLMGQITVSWLPDSIG